jgi:hypothetical protein
MVRAMINSEWRRLIAEEELFKESVMAEHTPDNVNSPAHYGKGKIECIDYIEDFLTREEYIGYLRGNIAKYQWYLDRLIKLQGKEDA